MLGIWSHLFETERSGNDGPAQNWTDNLKGLVVKRKICCRLNWPVLQVEMHFVEKVFFVFLWLAK